jgi:hypothetical protein
MEAKPVITVSGDEDLVGPVLQKTLQGKFKLLQRDGYDKDEKAFASFCDGMDIVSFRSYVKSCQSSTNRLVHKMATLHIYWTGSTDGNPRPNIEDWMKDARSIGDEDKLMIVFCVTPEVRSKRSIFTKVSKGMEPIEEEINKLFKDKCCVTNLRLASADSSRIAKSIADFTAEVNRLSFNNFLSNVSVATEELKNKIIKQEDPAHIYDLICKKLSLSIAYEMIRDPLQSSTRYAIAHDDLEYAITTFSSKDTPPWLIKLQTNPIHQWDYPRLIETSMCWEYLPLIFSHRANIFQIWSFLFVRRIHTLCGRGLVQEVYKCCIQTLHCTARIIKILHLSLPAGVFNSWSYMSCIECVESMMVKIDPEVLAMTPSASLILVRAELWHYAWEKLRSIGLLCHLMPGSTHPTDNSIIDIICSGISQPSENEVPADNQGVRLTEILKSKEKFKNAFMSLGEMVIGAFKHAGRRRMAFSIGTRMAEFHKEVGMVKEAEQLLCDVTSLYSVQRWPQLSSSAYSILAHCQKKLKQEDKEVYSLLVLVTTPSHSNSTHNPIHYLDQLINIAERSQYQKLLSWEPFFDLEGIYPLSPHYHVGEIATIKLKINYSGPKPVKLTIVTAMLQPESTQATVTTATDGRAKTLEESAEVLTEIELEPGPLEDELKASRPIGGDKGSILHKVYYSSSNLVEETNPHSISSYLTSRGDIINPGSNTVTISGKTTISGTFVLHQIKLKIGALDFCLIVPTGMAGPNAITILPDKVSLSLTLTPSANVMLFDVPVKCKLTLSTGAETSIGDGAELKVVAPPTVELQTSDGGIGHQLDLPVPPIGTHGSHDLEFEVTASAPELVTPKNYNYHGNHNSLLPWQCELGVYCKWLTPPHTATLPLTIYQPFSFIHKEYSSAGLSTFLQILMINTCPLPLEYAANHSLKTNLSLRPLNGPIPKVFYPGDVFSFIWQNKDDESHSSKFINNGFFKINYRLPETKTISISRSAHYNFTLSNLETMYHLKVKVDSLFPSYPLTVNHPVFIIYTVTNVTKGFRSSTSSQYPSDKLHYHIQPDPTYWSITSLYNGILEAPGIAQSVTFKITATPKKLGPTPPPRCILKLERGVGFPAGTGIEEEQMVTLTDAQCYNASHQMYHEILSSAAIGIQ